MKVMFDFEQESFWYSAPVASTPKDGPTALFMGAGFLAFGLTMILRPSAVRARMDHFADSWKQGGWHPYKMPDWGLRLAGLVAISCASLFFYIAYLALCH